MHASAAAFTVLSRPTASLGRGRALLALPGLGGNGLIFPSQFLDAAGAALDAPLCLSATYALPFGKTLTEAGNAVWAALRGLHPLCPTLPGLPVREVVLMGYSMGGFVAQVMAADPPADFRVVGVVLISTAIPSPRGLPVPAEELWEAVTARPQTTVMERLQGLFPQPWLRSSTEPTLNSLAALLDAAHISKAARSQELPALMRFLFSNGVERMRAILKAAPVLMLHGAQDRVLDMHAVQRAVRLLQKEAPAEGPAGHSVRLRLYEGAGHGLPLQSGPVLMRDVHAWWEEAAPSAAPVSTSATVQEAPLPTVLPALMWL